MKFIILTVMFIAANNCQVLDQRVLKPQNVVNSFAFDVYKVVTD